MAEQTALANGCKVFAETMFLPGSSLLLDGDVPRGVLHAAAGIAAKSLLGPIGWLLVGTNSFSQSVTGKPLHRHFIPEKAESAEEDKAVAKGAK